MPNKTTAERVLDHVASAGGRIMSLFTGLLAAFLMLYSGYVLYDTFYIQNNAFSNTWDLLDFRPEIIDDGAVPLSGGDTLASINEDYRAWLTIYDTNIDYPVMQGENDLYYASHDIYKRSSLTGALYLATANSPDFSDSYNLIYGHHMDNNAFFGGLDNYIDESYFNSHRTGVLVTPDSVYDLDIFAVLETDAYDSNIYTVGNRDLGELLGYISAGATHYVSSATEGATQIVAFSTCESAETNGRRIVFAVMNERSMPTPTPEPTPDPDDPTEPESSSEETTEAETSSEETTEAAPVPAQDGGGADAGAAAVPGDAGADAGAVVPVVVPDGGDTVTPGDGQQQTEQATEEIIDNGPPLDINKIIARFQPRGGAYGERAWALVNLICVIFTIFILIPLHRIKDKVNRAKTMNKLNENYKAENEVTKTVSDEEAEDQYNTGRFKRHLIIGFILEIIFSVGAVVAFILTENMRLPMTLIDKWTPLMLIILALCWVTDLILVRNRQKAKEEEEADQSNN